MADRHRGTTDRIESVTAAARIISATRTDAPRDEPWHDEAWTMRDNTGELRFAEMWLSNALSRSRLFAARRPAPGEEPTPVESGPAYDLVAKLAGGVGGQASLLRSWGPYLLTPGIGYLVGEPKKGAEKFAVVDTQDLRLSSQEDDEGNRMYDIRVGPGTLGWRTLDPGTVITKVHRPHPRRRWEPDSPVRAALQILRELMLLTQHVEASALSRLAGAGMQAFPAEMSFPGGWDAFIANYVNAITKPAKDRGLASALVPFPLKMPGDQIKNWKDGFMSYATPFDDKSIELREEAITRLGNAMDMPRQVLTGEQRNHWGDWQVEETGLKLHVEPSLETICEGLTVGYLEPGLEASTAKSREARLEIEAIEKETPQGEWIIWYDTSDLRVRPDRSEAATGAYDRWEANGDVLRKEMGLSDAEKIDPKDEETQQRVWFTLIGGEHTNLALLKLGLVTEDELQAMNPVPPALAENAAGPEDADGDGKVNEGGDGGSRDVKAPAPRGLPENQGPKEPTTPAPPVRRAAEVIAEWADEFERSQGHLPTHYVVDGQDPVPIIKADGVWRLAEVEPVPDVEVPDHPPSVTPGIAIVAALDGVICRAMERAGRRALNKMPRRGGKLDDRIPAERLHTERRIDSLLPMETLFEGAWERVPGIAERLGEDGDALVATCDAYARMLVTTQLDHDWDGLARALGVCPCEAAS